MSRVLKDALQELRQKLMTCFRETLPSKQFNALLSLSIIWLHVIVEGDEKIQDEEERRWLEDEFDEYKRSITNGIEMLYEQTNRKRDDVRNLSQYGPLPCMRGENLPRRTLSSLHFMRMVSL